MSDPSPWLKQIPAWVWCSFIPTLGGLSLVYAGRKSHTSEWIYLGLGICAAAIALGSYPVAGAIWIFQIAVAFSLKDKFLTKTLPAQSSYASFSDPKAARLLAEKHGKLDINTCSKDEMIRRLGLPIVYANDIDAIRTEGYMFTYLEELSEIAGLPESYLHKLQPLITFSYDIRKEDYFSWRRMNTCSVPELMAFGVTEEIAGAIVTERLNHGDYKSVVEVKKRTGLPFRAYQSLM
jgi:DNA uptake protein ComE-like DNA-binding protein